MDTFIDERDYKLLEADKYYLFCLETNNGRRLQQFLLSDHEKLIICFTRSLPFPVWIWTPEDASKDDMAKAYRILKENGFLSGEYRFNVKYALAEFLMKMAAEEGNKMAISTNMFAYDCLNPVEPERKAEGGIYCCESKDIEEVAVFSDMFHKELGIDQKDEQGYREDAEAFINSGNMYLWKDEQGNSVASCMYATTEDMASVSLVFTRPEFRRKHYAENLVYQVTMKAKEEGYIPMLYTDADYEASNACYEKIGYVLRGKLCTIG